MTAVQNPDPDESPLDSGSSFSAEESLKQGGFSAFEHETSVVYALDTDLRLIYCNQAWDLFAVRNGGSNLLRSGQIGLPVMNVVPESLREFYRRAYFNVLETREPWSFTYECSSTQMERHYHMLVHAAPGRRALIVVNSLITEAPHDRPQLDASLAYQDLAGFIIMCAHCRRVRTIADPPCWDWVPAFVEHMPDNVSHSLCPVCKELHYGPHAWS